MSITKRWARVALAVAATGTFSAAQAGFSVTTFAPSLWGASDATLGVSGYTIENFEDTTLAIGLTVSRLNGATGNFGPSSVLPANSVFDPLTDNDTNVTNPTLSIQAFRRGVWDGSHVLINHPGPPSYHWYADSANWKDLQFDFQGGATSVGFSLQQMDHAGNRLLVNGNVVVADLLGLLGAETEYQSFTEGPLTFNSRHGFLRIDAVGGDLIHSVTLDNYSGDGFAVDHLAFQSVTTTSPVPEPAPLALILAGLATLAFRLRPRQ